MDNDLSALFCQLLVHLYLQTRNVFTTICNNLTDSFHFAEKIYQQHRNLYMNSLDIDSLFTNIPVEYILHNGYEPSPKIPEQDFCSLLYLARESFLRLKKNI